MASQPATSNPMLQASSSASALSPQLDRLSVTAADQQIAVALASQSSAEKQKPSGTQRATDDEAGEPRLSENADVNGAASSLGAIDGADEARPALTSQRRPSGLSSTRPVDDGKLPDPLVVLGKQAETEPGYPSPSGAFVPPMTENEWKVQGPSAPLVMNGQGILDQRRQSRTSQPSQEQLPARPTSIPTSQATSSKIRRASSRAASRRGSSAAVDRDAVDGEGTSGHVLRSRRASSRNTERASFGEAQGTAQVQERSYPEPIPTGRMDSTTVSDGAATSSSSSSFLGGSAHSQAISARSSPSTVGPIRRPSSGLGALGGIGRDTESQSQASRASKADELNSSTQDSGELPSLKVRDFGFPDVDPRHIGAREVGVGSPVASSMSPAFKGGFGGFGGGIVGGPAHEWSIGSINDDEDDEDIAVEDPDMYADNDGASDDSMPADGLPLGLYHAAYDFAAESEHELDVKVGQRVRLVGHVDGGWAIVMRVRDGEADVDLNDETVDKGLVPEAYLQWLGA